MLQNKSKPTPPLNKQAFVESRVEKASCAAFCHAKKTEATPGTNPGLLFPFQLYPENYGGSGAPDHNAAGRRACMLRSPALKQLPQLKALR